MKKVSVRQAILNNCKETLRRILILERGERCELCRKPAHVGLFHILPVGQYPRIQLYKQNILLAGWFCCHYPWHHDPHQKDRIEANIKRLRGENYLQDLKNLNVIARKMTMTEIRMYQAALSQELKMTTSWVIPYTGN